MSAVKIRTPSIRKSAFTLIELLAVVLIIAILLGIAATTLTYVRRKASITRVQSEMAALTFAIDAFKDDRGKYPTSSAMRVNNSTRLYERVTNSWLLYTQLIMTQSNTQRPYYDFKPSQLRIISNMTYVADPWDMPYNYYRPEPIKTDLVNQLSFDLWSNGPNWNNDGGTNDDIANHTR